MSQQGTVFHPVEYLGDKPCPVEYDGKVFMFHPKNADGTYVLDDVEWEQTVYKNKMMETGQIVQFAEKIKQYKRSAVKVSDKPGPNVLMCGEPMIQHILFGSAMVRDFGVKTPKGGRAAPFKVLAESDIQTIVVNQEVESVKRQEAEKFMAERAAMEAEFAKKEADWKKQVEKLEKEVKTARGPVIR